MFDSLRSFTCCCYFPAAVRGVLLLAVLRCTLCLSAQQTNREKIDSLLYDVNVHHHDSLKMRGLVQLTARYWYNDLDSVQYYGNWAIGFVDSVDSWNESQMAHWHGTTYSNLGAGFSIHGNPDSALALYDRAEEIFLIHNDQKGLASVYGNRSFDYFDKGWYEMAYEANAKCLEISLKDGNDRSIALCYINMGDAHSQYDRWELATEMYSKALEISKKRKDYAQICRTYHSMAGMQRYFDPDAGLASLDSAAFYIPKAIGEQESVWATHLYSKGKLYSKIGRYDDALALISAAIDTASTQGRDGIVELYEQAIPALLNALGRYDESIQLSEKILPRIAAKNRGHSLKHSILYYSIALERSGKYKEALEQRLLYETLGDSLADLTKMRSIDETQAKFKVAEKEKEIAIQRKEKQALEERNDLVLKTGIGGGIALMLVAGSIVINLRNRKKRVELEREKTEIQLKVKEEEAVRLQEVERLKSRFFANISHEFRTPLTLILGPANEIRKHSPNQDISKQVDTIERNGHQLLTLIDQLLELSRLENQGQAIKEVPTNMSKFISRVADVFVPIAVSKEIQFDVDASGLPVALIDRDKVEKILFNLLSNAHKFTPNGGRIQFRAEVVEGAMVFDVEDNGPGIQPKSVERVFDRFYQTETGASAKGSGIGLALAKELSELLGGSVRAKSTPGISTIFTVTLPLKESEKIDDAASSTLVVPVPMSAEIMNKSVDQEDERPVILLVEDNDELRAYTRDILKSAYQVIEAENGIEGRNLAVDAVPDIILTDVMMPDMDGNEMCRLLKGEPTTNHIPIIMLTAKSSSANKITGLEVGADDYLLKPFNSRELQLKIQNLLHLTQRNRELYRDQIPGDNSSLKQTSPIDSFLIQVNELIKEHLSDPDFSVEKLAELVLMSRSQLFRKLKSLVDQTPVVYIRRARLHEAKILLGQNELNVSEVCYAVGFSSPAYFSKAFKEEFGESPSNIL